MRESFVVASLHLNREAGAHSLGKSGLPKLSKQTYVQILREICDVNVPVILVIVKDLFQLQWRCVFFFLQDLALPILVSCNSAGFSKADSEFGYYKYNLAFPFMLLGITVHSHYPPPIFIIFVTFIHVWKYCIDRASCVYCGQWSWISKSVFTPRHAGLVFTAYNFFHSTLKDTQNPYD